MQVHKKKGRSENKSVAPKKTNIYLLVFHFADCLSDDKLVLKERKESWVFYVFNLLFAFVVELLLTNKI